jgi:phosphoglycerol transferase
MRICFRSPIAAQSLQSLAAYAGAVLASLVLLAGVLKLWRADLNVPFAYAGDALFYQTCVKAIIDKGWYLDNDAVGAPAGLDMRDFPLGDNLHFLLLKLLAVPARSVARTYNFYFLLTFPLSTLATLVVFRRFAVARLPAVIGSLLFAFLPYHFLRLSHLFLASYFLIPFVVMVALWIYLDEGPFHHRAHATGLPRRRLGGPRSLGSFAIAVLVGSAGIYYAFFACYFLLLAGLFAALARRKVHPLAASVLLIAAIVASAAANLSPAVVYKLTRAANPEAVQRSPAQAEFYGLKIAQLLLPVSHHRLPLVADLKARYNRSPTPLVNENDSASLGILGGLGFVLLLGRLLYRRSAPAGLTVLDGLAFLNGSAVLLATIGGVGSLFSFLAVSWIRCYNRISIYIGFFALFTVTLVLDRVARRFARSWKTRVLGAGALALLLGAALFDQTNASFIPAYAQIKQEVGADADFIRSIEAAVPAQAMIFQLPYVAFPESARSTPGFRDYDHFRAYLQSRSLRWSYGTM